MSYTPLYIKTNNTLLGSMIKIPELINWAINNHIAALTITDNNMYGVMEFYLEAKKKNIKPIIGHEFIYNDLPVVFYCQNNEGYHNLIKLSTLSSEREITFEDIKTYSKGLLCILPYVSKDLDIPIKDVYYGYQNLEEKQNLKGKTLYFKETLYIEKEDSSYYPYLESIKTGTLQNNKKDNYILKEEEWQKKYPEDNFNQEISSKCSVEIIKEDDLLPHYPCPNNLDSFTYLKQLCIKGLKNIFGEKTKQVYIDRLKYELEVIKKMGFCDYFLVVYDYVNYAKSVGILVGPGRGSAAGSLVSYVLNITTIDPIKYNLFFERFLNPERITMPDIDIDFEYLRREEVINYCIEKYGLKKVTQIITFGTLGAKQAVRDVGKSLEIDLKTIDVLCNYLNSTLTLEENYNANPKLQKYLLKNEELQKLYKIASKLEGLKRHTSIHAAGVVISNKDLDEVIPLDKSHYDFYTTAYSMNYLEDLGLLKMDFLGLKNLTLINDVLEEINDSKLTFDTIPENDSEALNIFKTVNTLGIFQFESRGMINFLNKFKPETLEEIIASIALFRPGPMNNIDSYIKRKKGLEKIDYIHPDLVSVLKPTYGIIVYQEQIMQIATILAGYSLGEADVLRRAMSKKKEDILLKEKATFISRGIARGYDLEVVEKVYNLILKFASYGFNRAHSVAYAMIAYKMAYLKAHYKKEFIKCLLSMVSGSESKQKEYIYEARKNGIEMLPPDINISTNNFAVKGNNLVFPLTSIRSVGNVALKAILDERSKGNFKDIFDFISRCYKKGLNSKILENLILSGSFRSFNHNRKTLMENIELLINYGEITNDLDPSLVLEPELTFYEEYTSKEIMTQELNIFGFYLSKNPVTEYKLKVKNCVDLKELDLHFNKDIETVVYIDNIKEIETKNKEKMLFLTASDELETVDMVVFPKVYEKIETALKGSVVRVKGHVEKRFDKMQVIVNEINVFK